MAVPLPLMRPLVVNEGGGDFAVRALAREVAAGSRRIPPPPKLGGPPDIGNRNANNGMLRNGGHNAVGTVVSAPDGGLPGDGSKHSLPLLRSAMQNTGSKHLLCNHNQQPNHSCFMRHRNSGRELSRDQLPCWWRWGRGGSTTGTVPYSNRADPTKNAPTLPHVCPPLNSRYRERNPPEEKS
jgi:hypothetical protein